MRTQMVFTDLNAAKSYAKQHAPTVVNVGGRSLKTGTVDIDTPIGKLRACVRVVGTSGSGNRRPGVHVIFRDPDGGKHSQAHLQKLIDCYK